MAEKESVLRLKIKAVLDTSVLIAAFLRRGGVNARVLKRAGRDYYLYLGEPILAETRRVLLTYPRIRRRYHFSDSEVEDFVEGLRTASEEILQDLPKVSVIEEDPKDDFILACALGAGARWIVSKDDHLKDLGEYQGVKIVSTDDFLRIIRRTVESNG